MKIVVPALGGPRFQIGADAFPRVQILTSMVRLCRPSADGTPEPHSRSTLQKEFRV